MKTTKWFHYNKPRYPSRKSTAKQKEKKIGKRGLLHMFDHR
jgi:hypothetical protein